MSERLKVVIDRSRWIRGGPAVESVLLSANDRMCCLGFCLQAAGVSRGHLYTRAYPSSVLQPLPDAVRFLLKASELSGHKMVESEFTKLNDSSDYPDSERETLLTQHFARHGVDVVFVDSAPRTTQDQNTEKKP